MTTRLHFTNKEYKYKRYECMTACYLESQLDIPVKAMELATQCPGYKKMMKRLGFHETGEFTTKDGFVEIKFNSYGITHLHKDDVYDPKKGKWIADTKAQKAAYHFATKLLNGIRCLIAKNYVSPLLEQMIGCECMEDETVNHLRELSK